MIIFAIRIVFLSLFSWLEKLLFYGLFYLMFVMLVDFFTQNIWGIIILSVLCGIVGSIFGALLYSSLQKRYKNKKTIKYLVRVGKYFGSGARTVHAMRQTSFHQVLLVGDYLKEIVISAFKIIMYGIVSLALLILLRDYWIASPFIIGITGVLCGVEFKRLREFILIYRQMFEYVYGEEYFKSEMEGIQQHWDTLKKK